MDTTLKQVGELLLGAIPTVVLLLLLYAIYQNLVRKPLERVLGERRERTEGAVAKARADVTVAEARTQEYEQKLRDARMAVFKAQDARRQQAQQMRAQAMAEARTRAQQQIREARVAIEQDMAAARTGLQAETERLASDIIRTILKPSGTAPAVGSAR
jgi:F-type H+-transporting ATPase subunit b